MLSALDANYTDEIAGHGCTPRGLLDSRIPGRLALPASLANKRPVVCPPLSSQTDAGEPSRFLNERLARSLPLPYARFI